VIILSCTVCTDMTNTLVKMHIRELLTDAIVKGSAEVGYLINFGFDRVIPKYCVYWTQQSNIFLQYCLLADIKFSV